MEKEKMKKGRLAAFIAAILIFISVLTVAVIYIKGFFGHGYVAPNETSGISGEASGADAEYTASDGETFAEDVILPENPIDFSHQMELNDEIYAWIKVPNTNIDYPILQSREDDLYYLRRNIDKSYYIPGVIFTQSLNKRDFKDPVTVIYGHNMSEDGSMFATLHNFEDEEFFRENEYFYIYTPGHILTYRVVSAHKYDNRHIMNSFDFDDESVREEYFGHVLNPVTIPMNVREGVTLSNDDKLVVLSTCMANNMYRYLVNGVLVKDEATK